MCNLYSMTTNVEAIRRLFAVDPASDLSGNLPSMPGIFPDYPAQSSAMPKVGDN